MALVLEDVKRHMGVNDSSFDADITMRANAILAVLHQMGLCKSASAIDETSKWEDLDEHADMQAFLRQYMSLRIQLDFDPSTSSQLTSARETLAAEYEWRLIQLGKERNDDDV